MGLLLEALTDFMQSTGPAHPKNPMKRVNDATKASNIFSRYLSGRDAMVELVQGGRSINDIVLLDYTSNWERIPVNKKTTATLVQSGTPWTLPWSFARTYTAWTDQEIMLNEGVNSKSYIAQQFKSVKKQKFQVLYSDISERLDFETIGAVPNFRDMESGTPLDSIRIPNSLHVFVNEYDNGTTNPYADGTAPIVKIGGLGGAGLVPAAVDPSAVDWTQVQGIDPRIPGNETWRPYQGDYGTWQNEPGASAVEQGALIRTLFKALARAFRKTSIHKIAKYPEYSDPSRSPTVIYASEEGCTYYEEGLRANQSYFFGQGQRGGQDPHYNNPEFATVPVVYASEMDDIALYLNGTADGAVTELDATAEHQGPRFIGSNGQYLLPFFHADKFCEVTKAYTPDGNPEARTLYVNTWNNFGCRSRRSNFHLRPNGAAAV